jgi:hypothetical protein
LKMAQAHGEKSMMAHQLFNGMGFLDRIHMQEVILINFIELEVLGLILCQFHMGMKKLISGFLHPIY